MMILFYALLVAVVLILLFKILGRKIEDSEISKGGGWEFLFSEYFSLFKNLDVYSFRIDQVKGSKIKYHLFFDEIQVKVNFDSQIIADTMFTTYYLYRLNNGGFKLLHHSPKYRFENASLNQTRMFESIVLKINEDLNNLGIN